jgi:hypothetical protein
MNKNSGDATNEKSYQESAEPVHVLAVFSEMVG